MRQSRSKTNIPLSFSDASRSALEVLEAEVASESELRDEEACAGACPDSESDPDSCQPQIVSLVAGSQGTVFLNRGILRQVQIGHMAAALSTTFKSAVVQTIQSLPQHQQVRNLVSPPRAPHRQASTNSRPLHIFEGNAVPVSPHCVRVWLCRWFCARL